MSAKDPKFRTWIRHWRKQLLELTPFVKRKRYRKIVRKLEEETLTREEFFFSRHGNLPKFMMSISSLRASNADLLELTPLSNSETNELCLFVTFSPASTLKPHVLAHIDALLEENISVLLIINSDNPSLDFKIPEPTSKRLYGAFARKNEGFDFGAWAHAFSKIDSNNIQTRLYLVNDSLVGPLSKTAFSSMIASIRSTDADFVGLTGNALPRWHIQSFFLAFNKPLLHSSTFKELMLDVLSLPTKQDVIDVYETHLTEHLQNLGYRCKTVFPYLAPSRELCNDTIFSWEKLIDAGFPFIKSSIVRENPNHPRIQNLIPSHHRREC